MIKKVYSRTLKTFKTLEFKHGFNFLVSQSIDGLSNNGTGKTSLIQIINYCLCSSSEKISNYEAFNREEFSVDIEINNNIITLSRSPKNNTKIKIIDKSNLLGFGVMNDEEKSIESVKEKLNKVIFNQDNEEIGFRTLMSPFMKRGAYAFNNIFKTHAMEPNIVTQLKNSFLMGIPIEPIVKLKNLINERDSFLKIKEIRETDLIWKKENISTLKKRRKQLDLDIQRENQKLKDFNLNDQDSNSINEINEINKELSLLIKKKYYYINENENNSKLINNQSILPIEEIKKVLSEASFFVNNDGVKTLEEVQYFHEKLKNNRNERLLDNIINNENKIKKLTEIIEKLTEKKSAMLKLFDKKGYLDEYYSLNEILTNKKIELNELNKQYNVYEELNNIDKISKKKSIDIMAKMEQNVNHTNFKKINTKFSEYIRQVFSEKARLIMDFKQNGQYSSRGYIFDWEIPRKLSTGYLKGCISVYDLTISEYNSKFYPIFLIHDSVVFDSTDKGYVAKFLNLAYEITKKHNFQYICCVNDDQIVMSELNKDLIQIYNNSNKISQKNTLFGIDFGKR